MKHLHPMLLVVASACLFVSLAAVLPCHAGFTEVGTPLAAGGQSAWGDYDNDGDLDLVVAGEDATRVFRNDDGAFVTAAALVSGYTLAWGDYDNDGDLDIAVGGGNATKVYRNDSGSFTDIGAPITVKALYYSCSVVWGDHDSDGDLDLAVSGREVTNYTSYDRSKIYRNDRGTFVDDHTFSGSGCLEWLDYDNDGDLDLAAFAYSVSTVYLNDNGTFDNYVHPISGGCNGFAWGDYDSDGDLDLAVTASSYSSPYSASRIYRNDDGTFVDIGAPLAAVGYGSLGWGDYDNDGDLDLAVSNSNGGGIGSKVYCNDNGTFVDIGASIAAATYSHLAWGDYDNDGDLDMVIASSDATRLYRNDHPPAANTPPAAPTGLSASFTSNGLTLSWNAASDAQTPVAGLSYNVRIGSTPGGCDVYSGMADGTTGLRRLPAIGNAQRKLTWTLANVISMPAYYCSVQAIDTAFEGSAWSVESAITVTKISGRIRVPAPLPGVIVTASNCGVVATTDSDGYYELFVPIGWFGEVTPAKETYIFTPLSRSYSNVTSVQTDQDFHTRTFTDTGVSLTGTSVDNFAWGDYDSDGDLDIAAAGLSLGIGTTTIFRNDSGHFESIGGPHVSGGWRGSLAWGDYDNDGDLDLAVAGGTGFNSFGEPSNPISKIYCNDNGAFTDIGAPLIGEVYCSLAWGDYDNDGDLDLVVAGSSSYPKVYRNERGTFTDSGASLTAVQYCGLAWGDYNNDGYIDLAIAGRSGAYMSCFSRIYRNMGNAFSDIGAALIGVRNCSVAWGDYDNDGDLDLAIAGAQSKNYEGTPINPVSKIYRNGGGVFADTEAALVGVRDGTIAWGDYDNDGDLDLAIAGVTDQGSVCKVYCNDSGTFVDSGASLVGGKLAWADYDNDGDLDLAVAHVNAVKIYRNDGPGNANTPPAVPTGLAASYTTLGLNMTWNAATDAQTPTAGLSYNIRVGTTPGGCDVFSGMADPSTGVRRLPAIGNAHKRLKWTLNVPLRRALYCSIQAVDTAYAASAWAADYVLHARQISGHVRVSAGLPAVTITASNTRATTTTDFNGYYELFVPLGWSGAVTPSKTAHVFVPANRVYSNITLDQTNQDFAATAYTEASVSIPGVGQGRSAWGDYDNDGDLDLAIAGQTGSARVSRIYRNDDGAFNDIGASLTGVYTCSLAWGDYDNDGDLDLALAGHTGSVRVSQIYRNDSGAFADIGASLTGVNACSLAWGDYDNDGDLDLALAGNTGSALVSKVYRNESGAFSDTGASLMGANNCSLAWGDYDNDGDLDLAIAGYYSGIYRNDNGSFTNIGAPFKVANYRSVAWGDYDNDGDLDLAIAGNYTSKIYSNDSGAFSDIGASLTGVSSCSLAWGDYDNDGDLDLAIVGNTGGARVGKVYRNDRSTFADTGISLAAVDSCSLAWGDYDNDGSSELVLSGDTGYGYVTRLYRFVSGTSNTPPSPPTGLSASCTMDSLRLIWNAATDAQTPSAGLSYNVRIGSTPGACDVFSGMANSSTGLRRLPAIGNAQKRLSWTVEVPPSLLRCYYSVQAIDTSFAGSAWAVACADTDLGGAKSLDDEAPVTASGTVSAVFGDVFYIERSNRASGIRVQMASHGVAVGDQISVGGTLQTNDGERFIAASRVAMVEPAMVPDPLSMNPSAIGGGTQGLQGGVWGWTYILDEFGKPVRVWDQVKGLNNIGLLVMTCGRVTSIEEVEEPAQSTWFTIDDGSGINLKCILPQGVTIDPSWQQVRVTGVSSCERVGEELRAVVKVRQQGDVISF